MRGRWTHNKLGCVDGYRSALTLVPSLGLTIFGAAASTCDLLGDGDALTLPAAAALAAPLGEYLVLADARARGRRAARSTRVTGSYCAGAPATAARVSREADGRLVLRPAGAALTDDSGYSFELAFEANETAAGPARFRMLMTGDAGASDGVAWLGADARPGCARGRRRQPVPDLVPARDGARRAGVRVVQLDGRRDAPRDPVGERLVRARRGRVRVAVGRQDQAVWMSRAAVDFARTTEIEVLFLAERTCACVCSSCDEREPPFVASSRGRRAGHVPSGARAVHVRRA